MKNLAISILIVLELWLAACNGLDEPVRIVRLGKLLQEFPTLTHAQQQEQLDSLRPEIDAMFRVMGLPSPSIDEMLWWSESEVVTVFQSDVDSVFPNLNNLEHQASHIMAMNRKYHLGLPSNLTFVTLAWGRPQPMVRVDSMMLIALNHYLGADYPGYSHWEYYRRQEKTPELLPYDLAGALAATQYPFKTHDSPTLLSWMLYEGALIHARMLLLDQPLLSVALGYTPDQLEYLEDNAKGIWDDMRIMKVIYSTDPATIDRFLTASPVTPLVHHQVPGRVGRYIGYKIVMDYIKNNPGASLPFLLSPEFYDNPETLVKSGF